MRKIYWSAFVISCLGFAISLIVHIRSFMGFGLWYWFLLPIFALLPLGAWFMAADDVVHGGTDSRWRKQSRVAAESGTEEQMSWVRRVYRSWSKWVKLVNGFFVGYFLILGMQFFIKNNSANSFPLNSPRFIEAPIAAIVSCACLGAFWMYLATFRRVLELD